jgi:hypothetical protein
LEHLPLNGDDRALASSIEPRVEAVIHASAAELEVNGNGNGIVDSHIPLTGYGSRQREQGFLAGLMDRWR